MTTRLHGVGVLLLCLAVGRLPASAPDAAPSPAQRLWEQGQQAMREGRTDDAVRCYQQSLALDPALVNNHLSLAAACLDKGDDQGAAPHLARYLAARPDHYAVRAHYAELLLRLHDYPSARQQYQRFDSDVQEHEDAAKDELVHFQSRLLEIAEKEDDDYAAHLHRGIGLYLLAVQREPSPDDDDEMSAESLLCKAAGELTLARRERPEEARPYWYLFAVWSHLAQRQPAVRWLRAADSVAAFSYLTPSERRGLHLAVRDLEAEVRRK